MLTARSGLGRARIWAVTDGRAGMVAQALGLAEAIAAGEVPVDSRTVELARPWRWLPPQFWPQLWLGGGTIGAGPGSDPIGPPWPDIVVSCGRNAIGPALGIKRRNRGRTFLVHVQHPRLPTRWFDLIAAPAHDGLTGSNVMVTQGAVHRVTAAKLADAAERFRPMLAHLPRPLVAVLIGGANKTFRLTRATMETLASQLAGIVRTHGAGLAVTPSRRTGPENEALLRRTLAGLPAAVWDGQGDNPYLGYLALADAIVVTGDSVNMVSEAGATGKPVHVVHLEGGNAKFAHFHADMERIGVTRPFAGRLEQWSYPPLRETETVAAEVRRRLSQRPG
ncbi:MAG: mitochondrial fission ELM1 family protein [Alphaproteobacteria bacterium]